MIDLDALEASIADGEKRNLFVAPLVKDLIAELREARAEMHELRVMAEEADLLRAAQREVDELRAEVERLREERAASPAVVVTQGRGFTDMMLRCERLENEVMGLHAEVERLLEQAESTNFQREQDRSAVVSWLREVAETMNHNGDKCCGRVEDLADAVARGEHRREEER